MHTYNPSAERYYRLVPEFVMIAVRYVHYKTAVQLLIIVFLVAYYIFPSLVDDFLMSGNVFLEIPQVPNQINLNASTTKPNKLEHSDNDKSCDPTKHFCTLAWMK